MRIASYPGVSFGLLPQVIAEFSRQHSDVRLSLQTRSSVQVQEWLASQLFDIGIAELPIDHPAIDVEPIILDCVCVLPADHPLTSLEAIAPRDLTHYPVISLNPDHMTHFRLKAAFEAAGVAWRPFVECQLFASACALVAEGVGITLADPFTADDFKTRGVELRPFTPAIPFDIGLLYPSLRPRSMLTVAFEKLLKKRLQPYL